MPWCAVADCIVAARWFLLREIQWSWWLSWAMEATAARDPVELVAEALRRRRCGGRFAGSGRRAGSPGGALAPLVVTSRGVPDGGGVREPIYGVSLLGPQLWCGCPPGGCVTAAGCGGGRDGAAGDW